MTAATAERKTLIGFVAAVTMLALVSGVAIFSVQGYGKSTRSVSHTHEVIGELEALSGAVYSAEAARRGFIATGESFYLEDRDAALTRVQTHLQTAKMLTADNAVQQQRLRDLAALLGQRATQGDDLIILAQTEGLPAAQHALQAQEIRQGTLTVITRIEAMESDERALLASRQGGDEVWARILVSAFIVLLATVTVVLIWLFLRVRAEMTERNSRNDALDRANRGLEAANRELESFSYSVSHDLRSPLRAIDGYSLMLEEDYGTQLDETGRRYIRIVRSGSQRMATLIDDLLTFSRLSRQSLNRQTVDMTALARRAAAEVLDGHPEPKPVVAVKIDELPTVPGDPALLRQVWTNLISNAVKYSSKSAEPRVQVRAARQGQHVRYEVADNGVGFDMKYADKLFGVFQRLHSVDDYPGNGVGLAIVQRIIVRHDGAVTAQGERGKGATFGFTLPTET